MHLLIWQCKLLSLRMRLDHGLVCLAAATTTAVQIDNSLAVLRAEEVQPPSQLAGGTSALPQAGVAAGRGRSRPHADAASNALESISGFFWLHIPKCGSSFATTLAHFAAPSLPANVTVIEPGDAAFRGTYGSMLTNIGRFDSGHAPLTAADALRFSGKVVLLLRRPLDRAVSGYHHKLHDCVNKRSPSSVSLSSSPFTC